MGIFSTKTQDPADSTMSLGDHLEELRARIILALLGLGVGTVISLIFGKHIIYFIERPYHSVFSEEEAGSNAGDVNDLATAYGVRLAAALEADANTAPADPNYVKLAQKAYAAMLEEWLDKGLFDERPGKGRTAAVGSRLQTLAPTDGFVSYMKISLIAGLVISAPWVFYQLWMFVAAGLYPKERRYVHIAVPFSTVLFVCGALFFLLVVAPLAMNFLVGFNRKFLGVNSYFTFQNYISFVTMLMLVFGAGFQTPIAIFILVRTELVAISSLRKARKFVLLGMFFIAAVATPPDVISQVTLAIPLYILYELGILLGYLSLKKKRKAEEKESPPSEPDVY
ncbi:MAG: twin-arginine translocase subunit TatC [Planctomycetota bacterium]|jgi:sec-independent protein translocase protein TatC